MLRKWIKRSIILVVGLFVVGTCVFGRDVLSYAKSSGKWARSAFKDSVPVEFELRRARDLLEEIIPEMHVNINLIAREEVEVAALKNEVSETEKSVKDQYSRLTQLREYLKSDKQAFSFRDKQYSRQQVKDDLSWRFDRFKESELVLSSKKKLLETRQVALQSSMDLLEKTKSRKRLLASKIESMETQHRLLKATAIDSGIHIDNSKLAQTEKLIAEIKKRLNVAERVLAHENQFVQSLPFDEVTETELTGEIDEYFSQKPATEVN